MSKICGLIFRMDSIFIFGEFDTPYGWVKQVPATQLSSDIPPGSLGKAVLEILQKLPDGRVDIEFPLAIQKYDQYIKSMGFSSYRKFASLAVSLSIRMTDKRVEIVPYKNDGAGSFLPLEKEAKTCDASADEIGRLVISQRALC